MLTGRQADWVEQLRHHANQEHGLINELRPMCPHGVEERVLKPVERTGAVRLTPTNHLGHRNARTYATVRPPLIIIPATSRDGGFEPRLDKSSSNPPDMNIRKIPARNVTYEAVGMRRQNSRRRDQMVHTLSALLFKTDT